MAKRTDRNQTEIVKAFRQMGATVQILSDIGKGCPDIVVGFKGLNLLVEIKDGTKCPSAQKLTEPEEEFFKKWKGQVCIARNTGDAIKIITACFQNTKNENGL